MKRGSAVLVGLAVAACSIHPLPQNSTGLTTRQIVNQIRCEARAAVIEAALSYLTKSSEVDVRSHEIGVLFQQNPDRIAELRPALLSGFARSRFETFWNTGVAYNYTLTATEVNNVDASLDLARPLTAGLVSVPLGAGLDRQRQNQRTFTITDTFASLIGKVPVRYCTNKIVIENTIYPVVGRIGLDEVVQEFIVMSIFDNLGGPKDKTTGPPTLVDTLDFQTIVAASASPEVMFTPVGRVLRLSDAKLAGVASRKDDHQVIIGLALDKSVPRHAVPTSTLFGGDLLFASGGGAEQTAAAAADQVLKRRIFQPQINP